MGNCLTKPKRPKGRANADVAYLHARQVLEDSASNNKTDLGLGQHKLYEPVTLKKFKSLTIQVDDQSKQADRLISSSAPPVPSPQVQIPSAFSEPVEHPELSRENSGTLDSPNRLPIRGSPKQNSEPAFSPEAPKKSQNSLPTLLTVKTETQDMNALTSEPNSRYLESEVLKLEGLIDELCETLRSNASSATYNRHNCHALYDACLQASVATSSLRLPLASELKMKTQMVDILQEMNALAYNFSQSNWLLRLREPVNDLHNFKGLHGNLRKLLEQYEVPSSPAVCCPTWVDDTAPLQETLKAVGGLSEIHSNPKALQAFLERNNAAGDHEYRRKVQHELKGMAVALSKGAHSAIRQRALRAMWAQHIGTQSTTWETFWEAVREGVKQHDELGALVIPPVAQADFARAATNGSADGFVTACDIDRLFPPGRSLQASMDRFLQPGKLMSRSSLPNFTSQPVLPGKYLDFIAQVVSDYDECQWGLRCSVLVGRAEQEVRSVATLLMQKLQAAKIVDSLLLVNMRDVVSLDQAALRLLSTIGLPGLDVSVPPMERFCLWLKMMMKGTRPGLLFEEGDSLLGNTSVSDQLSKAVQQMNVACPGVKLMVLCSNGNTQALKRFPNYRLPQLNRSDAVEVVQSQLAGSDVCSLSDVGLLVTRCGTALPALNIVVNGLLSGSISMEAVRQVTTTGVQATLQLIQESLSQDQYTALLSLSIIGGWFDERAAGFVIGMPFDLTQVRSVLLQLHRRGLLLYDTMQELFCVAPYLQPSCRCLLRGQSDLWTHVVTACVSHCLNVLATATEVVAENAPQAGHYILQRAQTLLDELVALVSPDVPTATVPLYAEVLSKHMALLMNRLTVPQQQCLCEASRKMAICSDDVLLEVYACLHIARLGDFEGVDEEMIKCMTVIERALGADHPLLADVVVERAVLCMQEERAQEAAFLLHECLQLQTSTLGSNHVNLVPTLEALGRVHSEEGILDKAQRYYTQALLLRIQPDAPPADLTSLLANLAHCLALQEKYQEADAAYREALLRLMNTQGVVTATAATWLQQLSQLHRSKGEVEDISLARKLDRIAVGMQRCLLIPSPQVVESLAVSKGPDAVALTQQEAAWLLDWLAEVGHNFGSGVSRNNIPPASPQPSLSFTPLDQYNDLEADADSRLSAQPLNPLFDAGSGYSLLDPNSPIPSTPHPDSGEDDSGMELDAYGMALHAGSTSPGGSENLAPPLRTTSADLNCLSSGRSRTAGRSQKDGTNAARDSTDSGGLLHHTRSIPQGRPISLLLDSTNMHPGPEVDVPQLAIPGGVASPTASVSPRLGASKTARGLKAAGARKDSRAAGAQIGRSVGALRLSQSISMWLDKGDVMVMVEDDKAKRAVEQLRRSQLGAGLAGAMPATARSHRFSVSESME